MSGKKNYGSFAGHSRTDVAERVRFGAAEKRALRPDFRGKVEKFAREKGQSFFEDPHSRRPPDKSLRHRALARFFFVIGVTLCASYAGRAFEILRLTFYPVHSLISFIAVLQTSLFVLDS